MTIWTDTLPLIARMRSKLEEAQQTESTGQDCYFWKATDGGWYMGLEDRMHREEYDFFGPFNSEDAALDYLDKNFANPGGYSSDDSGTQPPPKKAINPRKRSSFPWR